jgi:hypothetical protein
LRRVGEADDIAKVALFLLMTDVHPSSMSSLASFDFLGHLDEMLSHLNLSRQDVVDDITLQGEDLLMHSACRLGASIGIPLLSVATAVSTIWNMRTGRSQSLSLDLRKAVHTLSPLMRRWTCINGYQVNAASLLGMMQAVDSETTACI